MRAVDDYPEGFRNLLFDWGVCETYGWGLFGYNLMRFAGDSGELRPIPLHSTVIDFELPLDPIEQSILSRYWELSKEGLETSSRDILLRAVGLAFQERLPDVPDGPRTQVACPFIERIDLTPEQVELLSCYDGIIAGSYWQSWVLEQHGLKSTIVLQGVDEELFRPLPKRLLHDRFVVFSGGQLALRKSQDIVVKAMSVFLKRHPDAMLLACWRSHWEEKTVPNLAQSTLVSPIEHREDMAGALNDWMIANGIPEGQALLSNRTPNRMLPQILRECDVALFPNRCEAGTNLVAMEALSMGIPSILSGTGQGDLWSHPAARRLIDCKPSDYAPGWIDPDVDEILDRLESLYAHRGEPHRQYVGSIPIWREQIYKLCKVAQSFVKE